MAAMPPDELSVWKTCQSADFADTKLARACVCVRVWEMLNCRQQYVPQYSGFGRQARNCPVIFCPRLPFRAKSNRKTDKKEKNKQKKSCSMRLWLGRVFRGGFDCFYAALWWRGIYFIFFKHHPFLMCACHGYYEHQPLGPILVRSGGCWYVFVHYFFTAPFTRY